MNIEIYVGGSDGSMRKIEGLPDGISSAFPIEFMLQKLMQMSEINLASAHLTNFNVAKYIPGKNQEELMQFTLKYAKQRTFDKSEFPRLQSLETSLRNLVESENGVVNGNNFYALPFQTRDTLTRVFHEFATKKQKKIAIPLPSWHFWGLKNVNGPAHQFSYFEAKSESELVDNFRSSAKSNDIGALVLVNPSNPLQYLLSKSGAKELDKIAQKYGITLILDEVLRGTMPIDARKSSALWFDNPVVIEGLSKRFGDEPLGNLSYCISPTPIRFDTDFFPETARHFYGSVVGLAMKYASQPVVDELTARNMAFDLGFNSGSSDGAEIMWAFPSSLTSLVRLPKKSSLSAMELATKMLESSNLCVNPLQIFYPDGYNVPKDMRDIFRVAVGRYDAQDMRKFGKYISGVIANEGR